MNFLSGALQNATLAEFPRTQLASSNPEKWDREWENLFQNNQVLSDLEVLFFQEANVRNPMVGLDRMYSAYRIFLLSTCTIQQRIGHLSLQHYAELERLWTQVGEEGRRKHVLIALSAVCSIAKNLNDARAYCSRELRLKRLSENPKVLLDLFKSIVPGPKYIYVPPETPYYIPNEAWDALSAKKENPTEMEKITLASMLMLRTKLIYLVVEYTLLSLLGKDFPDIIVQKNKSQPKTKLPPNAPVNPIREMMVGTKAAKQTEKDDKKAYKERVNARDVCCDGCGKAESDSGTRFMQCSACKTKMSRYVPYCSAECQKKNWKAHKPICGNPMNFDSVRESAQNLVERQHAERTAKQKIPECVVGPAVGGFKRPEALEYHILKLSNIPPGPSRADILVRISPTQTLDFVFPFEPAEVRNICIGVRDLAMTKGDRVAVATLCHYLVWMMASSRLPEEKSVLGVRTTWEHVLQQMSEEYDYPLPLLKVAVKELQERQTRDLARRPPLFQNLSLPSWKIYLAGNALDPYTNFDL